MVGTPEPHCYDGSKRQSKDGKRELERNQHKNRNGHEIEPPHHPATASSWTSESGTHRLGRRRDGVETMDG